MENMFDWNMLTRPPFQEEVQGPVWIGLLIFFAVGFLIATGFYLRPPASIKNHEVKRRATLKYSNLFMWAFGTALVFFAFQVMGLQYIGVRLWTWVVLAGILLVAILTVAYLVRQYPGDLAAYEERQVKRSYLRQTRSRPVGDDGRPMPRSSRAEKRRQRAGGAGARGR
jgi:hypothetical protein